MRYYISFGRKIVKKKKKQQKVIGGGDPFSVNIIASGNKRIHFDSDIEETAIQLMFYNIIIFGQIIGRYT